MLFLFLVKKKPEKHASFFCGPNGLRNRNVILNFNGVKEWKTTP